MPTPTERKPVQAMIIGYAEAIFCRHFRRRSYGGQGDFGCTLSRREMNRGERRDRKEDFDWAIWPQVVAESPTRKFSRRLCENRLLPSEQFCDSLLQNYHIV